MRKRYLRTVQAEGPVCGRGWFGRQRVVRERQIDTAVTLEKQKDPFQQLSDHPPQFEVQFGSRGDSSSAQQHACLRLETTMMRKPHRGRNKDSP
ncbi:hypothetical protein NDU88_003168 [Pleurodeles waltl]|uniref:Uncharacterized protein n=1 Tax=Pleurodeles waltl TaxID=8319 RepID=A0AAV7UBN3_PLEWA|nr:hypothetical protein NDU88_003168 [Pleurodeles waltl]